MKHLAVLAAGLAVVSVACGGADSTATSATQRGAETAARPDETTTTTAPAPIPHPDDPASYYSATGETPELSPTCEGIFGLCLGNPIEKATEMFGLEGDRWGDPSAVVRTWDIAGFNVSVTADEIGSITAISAALPDGIFTAGNVLALPDGLLLGRSTMADAARLGAHEEEPLMAENTAMYDYVFSFGPEGQNSMTFGYSTAYGEAFTAQDPQGFNEDLDRRPITSFSVSQPSV